MMGVGQRVSDESVFTLWMSREDLDAAVPGRNRENKSGPSPFDIAVQIMEALDITAQRVVLRVSPSGWCRASVDFQQGETQTTVDMRPSDALGLSFRADAPIYAEEAVVRRMNVAQEGVSPPTEDISSEAWKEELRGLHQHDLLRDKAFEIGLSPEEMIDTVRLRKDKTEGTVRLWLEAVPEREVVLDLDKYGAGLRKILEFCRIESKAELLRGGRPYTMHYSVIGEDARLRIVPNEADEHRDPRGPAK
jgi:uncharacterized protein